MTTMSIGKDKNELHRSVNVCNSGPVDDLVIEEMDARSSFLSILRAPLYEATMAISQKIVGDPVVQNLIRSNNTYDIVMTEAFDGYEHFATFAHKFNATGVALLAKGDSAWVNEMSGLVDNPSYMVDYRSPYSTDMGRMERLHNAMILLASRFHGYHFLVKSQAFVDKYFNYPGWTTRPPLNQLIGDQALVLVNSHHSIGYSYPKAPHVKEIGGVSVSQPRPLPKKIREFIEESEHGVIYFSLDNYVDFSSPFKQEIRNIFLEVFSMRRERVLWKWTGESIGRKPENIVFSSWLPQSDVLAHNQTKLFISSGGFLSMMDAVNFAVPTIGIVMGAQSRKNIRLAKESGYALEIDLRDLSVDLLNRTIEEIIGNAKYKEKAEEISSRFKDRPMKPVDEAVYWIEYVLKHGKVLQPASVRMSYYELHMWDLIVIGGLIVISLSLLVIIIIGSTIAGLLLILERRSPAATLLLKEKCN